MKNTKESVAVAVCKTHEEAEQVVKELQKSGFDMKKLSIVGKDYHEEDKIVGYYTQKDIIKSWGKSGAFWGAIWGMILGAAFFIIPGIGPVVLAGPIVSSLVGGLEGAVIVGGLSALGGALFSLGIPKDSVLKYEKALKASNYLVIAHGTPSDIDNARNIMNKIKNTEVAVHH